MITIHYSDINPDVKGIYLTNVKSDILKKEVKYFHSERIMLFLKGHGMFDFSGNIIQTSPGCALYIPSMAEYTTEFTDDQLILQICFDYIHFRDDVFPDKRFRAIPSSDEKKTLHHGERVLIDDSQILSKPFASDNISDIQLRAEDFISEYREKRIGYSLRIKGMLLDLLITMQRSFESSYTQEKITAANIISYINEHCESRLDRSILSEVFHYHPNHLNRIMMQATGMSLCRYITEAKLHRAEALLINTDLPITQIAMQLAFYDSSHFAEVFHKNKGVTPGQYRQMSRKL